MPSMVFQTWQFVVVALAGWLNRQQQDVVAYLTEEDRVLRERLKGKRVRFTDDQRRRLAAKGKALGRKRLGEVCTLVTPTTILRWYRQLIARKYDGSANRGLGRPRVKTSIQDLAVQMARENISWGYGRIQGALENPGHTVSRSTILKAASVKTIKLPPRSPNLSPHAEGFVRSIKSECLAKMIFFGERRLRRAVEQFTAHYHGERNHQGVGNQLLQPGESVGSAEGEIRRRERPGGLLRYYHRAA